MPKQSLIWTVLPNGISGDGKALRFSVLVSPRLEPEAAPKLLSSFSDFVAWPRTLARAKFALRIDSTTIPLDASHIDVSIGQPDEATWAALLPARTSVRTSTMRDHRADVVVSYDTVAMNNIVAGIYGELTAKAGTELPSIVDLLDNSKLGAVVAQVKKFDSAFFNKKRNARDVPGMFAAYRDSKFKQFGGPESPLPAFQLFHTPPNEMMSQTVVPAHDERLKVSWLHPAATRMDAAKAVSDLDFHQIIAAMNQYPSLLRRLGLVLDFTVPRTLVPKSANVHLSVNVELPKFSPSREVNLRVNRRLPAQPLTHTVHSATEFAAVSRPAPVDGDLSVSKGLLKLAPQRFALLQADVDGAGHKLLNFARTLGNHTRSERQVDPISKLARRLGVPALRNAGLMLVHQKRGNALSNAFERNQALNEHIKGMFTSAVAAAPGLFYEDLVRGWRIDIWDKTTARWRSLCERVSDYDINKGAVIWSGLREEGMVRLAVTSSTDGANPDVVFLHEAVTVWNGWSLVAQQPGNAIGTDDTSLRGAAAEVPDGIRLRTTFTSMTNSSCPSCTVAPTTVFTSTTRPGIGATMRSLVPATAASNANARNCSKRTLCVPSCRQKPAPERRIR